MTYEPPPMLKTLAADAGMPPAKAHRQGALGGAAIGLEVADVVDDENRAGQQADRNRQRKGRPRQLLALHEVGARHRHDAEEQKHEQLAKALIAVGARAARVEHPGQDRGGPDGQQLRAGDCDQIAATQHRQTKCHVGGGEHALRRNEATRGHPDWTQAIPVGDVTSVTLDIAKDNLQFGVRAVDKTGHRSPVGFPVTNELVAPDRIGRYNHFSTNLFSQTGSIYWTSTTGAHSVVGAIRDRWRLGRKHDRCYGYPDDRRPGARRRERP